MPYSPSRRVSWRTHCRPWENATKPALVIRCDSLHPALMVSACPSCQTGTYVWTGSGYIVFPDCPGVAISVFEYSTRGVIMVHTPVSPSIKPSLAPSPSRPIVHFTPTSTHPPAQGSLTTHHSLLHTVLTSHEFSNRTTCQQAWRCLYSLNALQGFTWQIYDVSIE